MGAPRLSVKTTAGLGLSKRHRKEICWFAWQIIFLCTESKQLLIQYHTLKSTNFAFKPSKKLCCRVWYPEPGSQILTIQLLRYMQTNHLSGMYIGVQYPECKYKTCISTGSQKSLLNSEFEWLLFNAVRQALLWALGKNPFSKTALLTWNCVTYFNMVFQHEQN